MFPPDRRRDRLAPLVGVVLVTTALWAPALHLTGDRVTYRATTVEPAPDGPGLAVGTDDSRLRTDLDEVACYGSLDLPRVCALEAVLANGSGAGTTSTGSVPVRWSARFVYLRGPDAGFYRRTPPAADAPTGSALGLEPVDAETVLSTVAVDADARHVDDVAREAIDAGSATVHEDRAVRAAGRVYAADGTYYLVYESTRRTPLVSKDPAAARTVEAAATLAGLVALLWAAGGREGRT